MASGDVYRLSVMFSFFTAAPLARERLFLTTLHFRARADGTSPQDLCDNWATNLWPTWQSVVGAHVVAQFVQAFRVLPAPFERGDRVIGEAGTATGAARLPLGVCGLLWWVPDGVYTRRKRGRIFLSGLLAESGASDDYGLSLTNQSRIGELATATLGLYGPAGSEPYELGVWSFANGGDFPTADPAGFTPTVDWFISVRWAYRASRARYRMHPV